MVDSERAYVDALLDEVPYRKVFEQSTEGERVVLVDCGIRVAEVYFTEEPPRVVMRAERPKTEKDLAYIFGS